MDEVTHVELLKGETKEVVIKRHSSVLILYLSLDVNTESENNLRNSASDLNPVPESKPIRKAAIQARRKIQTMA